MAKVMLLPRFLLPQSSWITSSAALVLTKASLRGLPSVAGRRCIHSAPRRQIGTPFRIHPRQSLLPNSYVREAAPRRRLSKAFSTTSLRSRDHHFDTLKFVQRLRDEGFSEEQSKAMMLVLSDVIEESIQNLTRTMVPKEGNCDLPRPPFSDCLAHPKRLCAIAIRSLG